MSFDICIYYPRVEGVLTGNLVSARRWQGILSELGCNVELAGEYTGKSSDIALCLNARKSADIIARLRKDQPQIHIILALTGTDIYGEDSSAGGTERSLALADQIIQLQPRMIRQIPKKYHALVRTVFQSVELPALAALSSSSSADSDSFEVLQIANLREVKDPLLAARAVSLLPASSRVNLRHIGAPLDAKLEKEAAAEMKRSMRYSWMSQRDRAETLRMLQNSKLLLVCSKFEGAPNVISEAVVLDTPLLCSRIDGNIGLLGEDYPGCFEPGNAEELGSLLNRAEIDKSFYAELLSGIRKLRPNFERSREIESWKAILRRASQRVEA